MKIKATCSFKEKWEMFNYVKVLVVKEMMDSKKMFKLKAIYLLKIKKN